MFRINKAFENDTIQIFRIEGKVTDESLSEWNAQMNAFRNRNGRQIILDFAQVWFICLPAMDVLVKLLSDHVFVLNCGIEVRNVLHASGLSGRILE